MPGSAGLQGRTVQGALFDQLSAQNTLHRSPPKDPRFLDGFVLGTGDVLRRGGRRCLCPHRRLHTSCLGFGAVCEPLVQALASVRIARRRVVLERGDGTACFLRLGRQRRPRGDAAGGRCTRDGRAGRLSSRPVRRRCDVPAGAWVLFGVGWVTVRCGGGRLRDLCRGRLIVRGVRCWSDGFFCCLRVFADVGFRADHPRARSLFHRAGPRVIRGGVCRGGLRRGCACGRACRCRCRCRGGRGGGCCLWVAPGFSLVAVRWLPISRRLFLQWRGVLVQGRTPVVVRVGVLSGGGGSGLDDGRHRHRRSLSGGRWSCRCCSWSGSRSRSGRLAGCLSRRRSGRN